MKLTHTLTALFVTAAFVLTGVPLYASSATTQPAAEQAIDFTLTDSNGTTHTLSDYQGKHIVLEWINFDCPFVKKHYKEGAMPALQQSYRDKGVIWLAICRGAGMPGRRTR